MTNSSAAFSETIHLACATEGPYFKHAAAMLASAFANGGGTSMEVFYMHDSAFPREARDGLKSMAYSAGAAISFAEVSDRRLRGLPTRGFTRKATWYRILLPELRPDLDRIIYLDSDALVLDSLKPLRDLHLGGHLVAAVTNIFQEDWIGRAHELGIPPRRYFNAGVLVLNLAAMREARSQAALFEYGLTHAKDLTLRDQDALNVILGGRRLDLHPRWNCMNSVLLFPAAATVFGEQLVREARERPAVRHFEGPEVNKPWHPACQRDMRELYEHYRGLTPWPHLAQDRGEGFIDRVRRRFKP